MGNASSDNGATEFTIFNSISNVLEANESRNNTWFGLEAHLSLDMTWIGNHAISNDGLGFLLAEASSRNTIKGNAAYGNGDIGFSLIEASNDNSLEGNIATGNAGPGFALDGVTRSLLKANVARGNADGFSIYAATDNELLGNRSIWNGYGFVLNGESTDNTIAMNMASGNAFEGIAVIFGSSNNEIVGNLSERNAAEGISLYFGADSNLVRGNVLIENNNSRVLVFDSSYNSITRNRAMHNNTSHLENAGGVSIIEGSSFNEGPPERRVR